MHQTKKNKEELTKKKKKKKIKHHTITVTNTVFVMISIHMYGHTSLAENRVKLVQHDFYNAILYGHEGGHFYGVHLSSHHRRTKHYSHVGGQHLVHTSFLNDSVSIKEKEYKL